MSTFRGSGTPSAGDNYPSAADLEAAVAAAAASALAAANSASTALAAQVGAELAETNAETAETNAETAQTAAEAAQSAAETAQTAAELAETNAETAETNAETAETNAETAETGAVAAYDSFDDRYLGAKASDPTLDNDGDALLTGALYWKTAATVGMRAYNGSAWEDVNQDAYSKTEADALHSIVSRVLDTNIDSPTASYVTASEFTITGIAIGFYKVEALLILQAGVQGGSNLTQHYWQVDITNSRAAADRYYSTNYPCDPAWPATGYVTMQSATVDRPTARKGVLEYMVEVTADNSTLTVSFKRGSTAPNDPTLSVVHYDSTVTLERLE